MPGQKKRVLRNCFVFTISWWVSCASDRICFRRDCGTTIRFPLRFTPSKIVNSSFMRLYGLRSCPLPIIPYVSHGKRALFFSLSSQRSEEAQKKKIIITRDLRLAAIRFKISIGWPFGQVIGQPRSQGSLLPVPNWTSIFILVQIIICIIITMIIIVFKYFNSKSNSRSNSKSNSK